MAITEIDVQNREIEVHKRETLDALLTEQVLLGLGEPADVYKVQVRPLWDNCYRVNVYLGTHAVSARLAHSFFLRADADGTILESTPRLPR